MLDNAAMELQGRELKELKAIISADYGIDLSQENAENLGALLSRLAALLLSRENKKLV